MLQGLVGLQCLRGGWNKEGLYLFEGFTAWTMLLWIVAAAMILLPILAMFCGSVISVYFKMKERHQTRMIQAFAKTLSKALEDATNAIINKTKKSQEEK